MAKRKTAGRGRRAPGKKKKNQQVLRNLVDKNGMFSEDLLKLVAVVTMLIDHVGAGILEYLCREGYVTGGAYQTLAAVDTVLRNIGRVAFPLFVFLLVQGFLHTSNRLKYGLRLFVFALLSELPFDCLFYGGPSWQSQNIFWTLLLGLLTLYGIEMAEKMELPSVLRAVSQAAAVCAGMVAAGLMKTDYSWKGILLIAAVYVLRNNRARQCIGAPATFLAALFADRMRAGRGLEASLNYLTGQLGVFVSFWLIYRCNGKRYLYRHKYFFYAFYPVHLLILLLVRCVICLGLMGETGGLYL